MYKQLVEQIVQENPKGVVTPHMLVDYASDFGIKASFDEDALYDALIKIDEVMAKEIAGEPVEDAVYQSTIPVTFINDDTTVIINTTPLQNSSCDVYFGIFIEDLEKALLQQ